MKDILVILPQMRDLWSIDHAGLSDRFRVRYVDPDPDLSRPFDAINYLDRVARIPTDAPAAVPRYAILGPSVVFEPPFFVKPVFGTLSGGARRIDDLGQLALLDGNGHARRYAKVAEMIGLTVADACGYLVWDKVGRRS